MRTCAFLLASLAVLPSCGKVAEEKAAVSPSAVTVQFHEVTQESGIGFRHVNGAFGKKYLPETMGSGAAFLDYDGDGDLDIFLVQATYWAGHRGKGRPTQALYRNDGRGRFTDVSAQAGVDLGFYGQGVAAADYDNDGDPDLYVTAVGPNRLFRNEGNGTFTEVAREAGVADENWGTSAAWFDYDRDGWLDLFVCNYVQWSPENDLWCTLDGVDKSYCTPESYQGTTSRLFRNRGNGTFEDVTRRAGLYNPNGKALGITLWDFNEDGWLDLVVAQDTQPNLYYHSNGNGTFTEQGVTAGVAFDENGKARAGMGIDVADYQNDGAASILIGNFSNEMTSLYRSDGSEYFTDYAVNSRIGPASLLYLTFGCFFFDYDLDGYQDIFSVNGHIENDIEKVQKNVTYAQAALVFHNARDGIFRHATDLGPDLQRPIVGRGAAYGDYDGDGDLDVLVTENHGPAHLYRNDGGSRRHWLRVRLRGNPARKNNRDGIGARIVVQAGGVRQVRVVRSGSSYCSQSELVQTFGLDRATRVEELKVVWPSGKTSLFSGIDANRVVTVHEDQGLL